MWGRQAADLTWGVTLELRADDRWELAVGASVRPRWCAWLVVGGFGWWLDVSAWRTL